MLKMKNAFSGPNLDAIHHQNNVYLTHYNDVTYALSAYHSILGLDRLAFSGVLALFAEEC
jgi:hypothetical protein